MPHSHGKRQNTRDKYSMPFRRQGLPGLAHYMTQYKVGDLVDIVSAPSCNDRPARSKSDQIERHIRQQRAVVLERLHLHLEVVLVHDLRPVRHRL